jgi:hypothetical protein
MKKTLLLIILILNIQLITAQYTEIINSKRPGFSESPYSIGTNVYQFETGLFYRSSNNTASNGIPKSIGGNLFFRYGKFSEKLEFNADISYQKDKIYDIGDINTHINPLLESGNNSPYNTKNISGISHLTIGAKYLLYQQKYTDKSKEIRSWKRKMAFDKKRLIPSVGVYAGVNTNFLSPNFKDAGISYKAALLLQNDFSDRLVVLTNLIADKITSDFNYYTYIITMTYALSEKWSYFIENQGIYSKLNAPKYNFGSGIAYLYSNDIQLDTSIRTIFFDDYSFVYASVGVAWRLDRHKEHEKKKLESKGTSNLSKKLKKRHRKKRRRGNIFTRIFKKRR